MMMYRGILATVIFAAYVFPAYAQNDYGLANPYAVKVASMVSGVQSRIDSISKNESEKGVKIIVGIRQIQVHSDKACEIVWVNTSKSLGNEIHTVLYLKNVTSYLGKGQFKNNALSSRAKPVICETRFNTRDHPKISGIKRSCRKSLSFDYDHGYPPEKVLEELAMAVEWCNRGENDDD